jgi:tetratricopeptide (TPR) repeat protein/cold shock CspA family protein
MGQEALEKFSEDVYIRSEMCWIIYDLHLKPTAEKGEFATLKKYAEKALSDYPGNDLFTTRVVSLVMKSGKKQPNPDWETIGRFALMVEPDSLSAETRVSGKGKRFMAEREEWAITASRAMTETGKFDKAIEVCKTALRDFPQSLHLKRNLAQAEHRSGNLEAALEVMRPLLSEANCPWYVKSELAEMEERAGNDEDAWRLYCQAMAEGRENQFKLKLFEQFAALALKMGKPETAKLHTALARAVREENEWKVPEPLSKLEGSVESALGGESEALPATSRELEKLARAVWREGQVAGLERLRGRVKTWLAEKRYGFIEREDGGEDLIVFEKDLPAHCREVGAQVEFTPEESYDKKKDRQSWKAAQVEKIQN